jgi:undecaprenyl diphosphate synthase
VEILTLFAFSQENWSRPALEVAALMLLLEEYIAREMAELRERGVEAHVIGNRERLTPPAQKAVEAIERATAGGTELQLNLCISYSSREEIARAARLIASDVQSGRLDPEGVDEEVLASYLYTAPWPDPDLLVRTSGEQRLSNFLLWQLAYTELYVTPVLWPEFGRADLFEAIRDYQRRERRFGRVTA